MLLSPVTEPAPPEVDEAAQRRTVLVASLVGTTVEWYDFFLYATAATIVFNHAFFPSQSSTLGTMLAFATFAVGFVMRPILARRGLLGDHGESARPKEPVRSAFLSVGDVSAS